LGWVVSYKFCSVSRLDVIIKERMQETISTRPNTTGPHYLTVFQVQDIYMGETISTRPNTIGPHYLTLFQVQDIYKGLSTKSMPKIISPKPYYGPRIWTFQFLDISFD